MPIDALFASLIPELQSTLSTCKLAVLKCEAMMALLSKAKGGDALARVLSGYTMDLGSDVSNHHLPQNPSLQSKNIPSRAVSGSLEMGIRWDPEDYTAFEEISSTSANPTFAASSKQYLARKLRSSLHSSNQSFTTARRKDTTPHFRRESSAKSPQAAIGLSFDASPPRNTRDSVMTVNRRDPDMNTVANSNPALPNQLPSPHESLTRNMTPNQKPITSSNNLVPIPAGQYLDFFYQMRINGLMPAVTRNTSSAESVEVSASHSVMSVQDIEKMGCGRNGGEIHPKVKAAYKQKINISPSSGDVLPDFKKPHFAKLPSRPKDAPIVTGLSESNDSCEEPSVDWYAAIFLLPAYDDKGRRLALDSFELEDLLVVHFVATGMHPKSVFNTYWDVTMIALFSAVFWMVPFVISFQPLLPDKTLHYTCYTITVIYFFESLISAVTPVASVSTSVIYSFREYELLRPDLSSWLNTWILWKSPLEFLTLIPFEIMFPNWHFNRILLLIKLIRSWKLRSMISRCALLKRLQARLDAASGMAVSKIMPIAVAMMFFVHWNACVMYLLGRRNRFTGWDTYWRGVNTANLFQFYTWTTYQSLGNMFPRGFFPDSAAEQLIYSVFIIFAAVLYASFLGAISSATMSINPAGRLYTQKMEELLDYVKFKNLPQETTEKLFDYYETKYRGKYFEEEVMLAEMNESLRAEILLKNTRALIEQVPFLRREENDGRDEIFIGRIARALRSHYYVQGDFITKQGDTGYDMFFILSGKLDVTINNKCVVSLYDGSYIGEVALISKGLRTATVQAAKPSVLYRLTHHDFHEILGEFPDMLFRINQLALDRERILGSRY
ncbi:hypothetical protein CcCBS67573_g06201 [Chytriomyces confervae]|uniref:Cyclic nucleotide-binding domain-containing protein n=1 Tax=Chytriomyces confervae TaxID=246404 RepID=A0A507F4Y2_9FUNG|nr:hypothetical protein CcCBS67573_g06201 [Chytriomyces confervae]